MHLLNISDNRGYIPIDQYNPPVHREEQNHTSSGPRHISQPPMSQYSGVYLILLTNCNEEPYIEYINYG